MFEGKPITAPDFPRGEGTALRAIGWGELTARINAARDLRQVLRSENPFLAASFSDAAAGYFSAMDDGKPAVNPDVLEHRKHRGGMEAAVDSDAAEGDREK